MDGVEPYRFFDVRVRPCADSAGGCRWNWQVFEDDGRLIEAGATSEGSEAAARNAGNAAARAIRKRLLSSEASTPARFHKIM
jgi:hypothetical protein